MSSIRFTPSPDPDSDARIFNDDLLTNPGDLHHAEERFPDLFPLLDDPGLRNVFLKYERRANTARLRVHGLGLLAVFFATVALLGAATESLRAHTGYARGITIILEAAGVLAALIIGGSLWLGPWKKRWLESRFMTERLRQWHFQMLIRRANELETFFENRTDPESVRNLQTQRQNWLDDFLHEHEGKLDSRMDSLAHDPDFSNDWLHDPPTHFKRNSPILPRLFDAYRRLRFLHQYDYVTHELSLAQDHSFWAFLRWPLLRQEAFIRGATSFFFVAALLCALAVIASQLSHESAPHALLGSLTLVIAITGVALRTIQEGLGITEDIERYRNYRAKVRRKLLHFDATQDQQEKLHLMEELELAAVDELRGFLRAHSDARFAL